MRPFYAVFGLAGDSSEGTKGNGGSWCIEVKLAFDAGGEGRKDDPGLALEPWSWLAKCFCVSFDSRLTFSATVH